MTRIFCFPPVSSAQAQVLILGSMPGVVSLRLRQYYGHPQNTFWRIMGENLGFDPAGSYEQRTAALVARQVALWDVLAACVREGSLDSRIDAGSIVPNDFAAFFATHSHVRRIFFNGAKAESLYRRHVLPRVARVASLEHVRLPSTSPAHAGLPLLAKAQAWRVVNRELSGGWK